MSDAQYDLKPGLGELLEVLIEKRLPLKVETWQAEITKGVISDGTRQVFVALGWIEFRDARVRRSESTPSTRRRRVAEGQTTVEPSDG